MTSTKRRRPVGEFVVERVETVTMTDEQYEQYEQAVNTLATLIGCWMTGSTMANTCRDQAGCD